VPTVLILSSVVNGTHFAISRKLRNERISNDENGGHRNKCEYTGTAGEQIEINQIRA